MIIKLTTQEYLDQNVPDVIEPDVIESDEEYYLKLARTVMQYLTVRKSYGRYEQ